MKRVLIVSYFFPPASNMGSHRILRFVRHLREFGWEPIVLAGKFARWTPADDGLLERVPSDVEVHRIESVDLAELWQKWCSGSRGTAGSSPAAPASGAPSKTHAITTFLNRWVMIPDKYFPWIRPAARAGAELVRDKQVAAIYSTSDPNSDHLVALRVARRTGAPFVAEFRDLWMGSPYFARAHPTPLHRALHARLERRVVAGASAIVALSAGIRRYFSSAYPGCAPRVIYNCFDPAEYPPAANETTGKFRVLYAGALYSSRSPEPFFAGFSQFVKQHGLSPAAAEFVIVGGSADLDLAAMAGRHGMTDYLRLVGRVSHAESLRRMQSATALLTVQSPDDNVHVPGKLFEYIGAGRPILAMSRPCEAANMIQEHDLGWVAEPDGTAVAATLAAVYAAWKKNGHDGLATQAAGRFSVHESTRQLAEQLEAVCARQ